jgi:stage III sporulation protein AG
MNRWKEILQNLWKDLGIRRWMFVLVVGILLVVIALPGGSDKTEEAVREEETKTTAGDNPEEATGEETEKVWTKEEYEAGLEKRLTAILSQIEGAGQVEVMVTVKTSGEKILQTDTKSQESIVNEKDSSGGTRQNVDRSEDTETILVGDSSAEPYIVQEIMPQVEGVLVACQGGDKATVQSEISGAIQALFGIEAHKIKVCKKAS